MEQAEISCAAIAKQLLSCSQSSRQRAIRLLCSWLPNLPGDPITSGVSDSELIEIWKGLFFCVWCSGKLITQINLINRLSTLVSSLSPQLSVRYLDAFLLTIRREWSGIDALRLDKFYLLIRRFLRNCFFLLKKNSWDADLTDKIVRVLSERSLLSVDEFPAAGFNYYIAEILLDEILKFLPLSTKTLVTLLKPFLTLMHTTSDKVLLNNIKVAIFDRLAENGAKLLIDKEMAGEVEKFGKIALAMGFSKMFFDLAAAVETQQDNIQSLLGLHERFLKLEEQTEISGLDISLEHISSSGDGDNNEKLDDILIQKMKEVIKSSNGIQSKTKKKKKNKKSLISSIDCNGVDSKSKRKISEKEVKLKDFPAQIRCSHILINDAFVNSNNSVNFDDSLISNHQKQFETITAETDQITPMNQKKPENADNQQAMASSENAGGDSETGKTAESNAKKVRFSMINNIVWKPQNPLPPRSLRIPPSATPRGSALKKGLSPGPIRETPSTSKSIKVKGSSLKKGRKTLKTVSPGIKRLMLLEAFADCEQEEF